MGHGNEQPRSFIPLNIAVLTVSDTRTEETDTSGKLLREKIEAAGHQYVTGRIEPDDMYRIRATVSEWIADLDIHAIITTGGTGITGRDGTPEAISPLLDKAIEEGRLTGEHYRGEWVDVGTPQRLQNLNDLISLRGIDALE